MEQNPAITTYTDVGDIVIAHGIVIRQVKGCCSGLMYIKGDYLCYEMKCGSNLCCTCHRYRFKLLHIDIVDILNDQTLRLLGGSIHLSPGLRITAYPNITVLVAMPDAAIFGPQLAEASNRVKGRDGGRGRGDASEKEMGVMAGGEKEDKF